MVSNAYVPEVINRVEHRQMVQPVHVVEQPVVHQVVSVNRRMVAAGAPYVAGLSSTQK